MQRLKTREHIRDLIYDYPDGIALAPLHKVVGLREVSNLQLRSLLKVLTDCRDISSKRITLEGRRKTIYYPYDGTDSRSHYVRRKAKDIPLPTILDMNHFMVGKAFCPYLYDSNYFQ